MNVHDSGNRAGQKANLSEIKTLGLIMASRVSFNDEQKERDDALLDDDESDTDNSSSSDEESSDDEETKDRKARKMALWERPTEVFETLECGGYTVQYKVYMLEKPPPYFYNLKPEYQMFSLRSRVIKYREEVLERMLGHLEDKLGFREEELEGLDTQAVIAGDPAKKLYVVQTDIFHSDYEITYFPGKCWREDVWLEKNANKKSFPQALELEKARALILKRVVALRKEVSKAREELDRIGQFAGDSAAIPIQKVFRGYLGRLKVVEKRRTFFRDRQIRMAGKIQRVWRGFIVRKKYFEKFLQVQDEKRQVASIEIQRIWRGWLARQLFVKLEAEFRARREHNKAVKIQAWFRGTRGRKIANIKRKVAVQEEVTSDYLDSTVQIQRFIRGWLGRKKVVARKVEVKLNKRVKKLAYDYISKGSFWEFLGAVNNDYQRYNEQRQREEDLAATFINQVLKRREEEQQSAWKSWNNQKEKMAVRGKGAVNRNNKRATRAFLGRSDEDFFKKTMEWANKTANKHKVRRQRRTLDKGSKVQLQPLLSTTLTWDNSVLGSRAINASNDRQTMVGGANLYSPSTMSNPSMENVERIRNAGMGAPMTGMSQTSMPGPGFVTPEASAVVVGGVSVPAGFNIGEISSAKPYSIGSLSGPGLNSAGSSVGTDDNSSVGGLNANLYAPLTSALEQESSVFEGVTKHDFERFPAHVLTRDITNADDDIDRLLLHAALRTYIPPTSKAMTGLDAFEEFLRMPPGLMKVKREAEASRYAQPYKKILKYNGFKTIKMLKRCSATQMTALGIPAALAQMIGRLMRQLFRSWKNVDPSYLEKLSVTGDGSNIFLDRSSHVENFVVPDDLNKIDDSSAFLQSDDALFMMDESKILPGGNNEGDSLIKMGDGRELQDLWPYGNDALEMKVSGAKGSGFESATVLAASPATRESLSRQLRPETAQTIDYGGESRPSTAMSSVSRPGTRGTFGSRGSMVRPSTGDIRELQTRESSQSGGTGTNASGGGILRPTSSGSILRPSTPGILRTSTRGSIRNSSEHGGGVDGVRPNTRGSTLSVTLKEPTPREHRRGKHQGRPGTTGNNQLVASPIRSPTQDNKIEQRPATEGGSRKKLYEDMINQGLPRQHRSMPRPNTGSSGNGMTWRPRTATSNATSRPSTQGTVDYGFNAQVHTNINLDYDAAVIMSNGLYQQPQANGRNDHKVEEKKPTPRQRDGSSAVLNASPNANSPMRSRSTVGNSNNNGMKGPPDSPQTVADKLREKLSKPLTIQSLDVPFENLIVNAALHVYNPPGSEFETGEESFEQFIADLVSIPVGPNGEKERRECVRRRTKSAFKWAQKFVRVFKSYNLYTIRDLVDLGRPLEAFGLPEPLANKVQKAIQTHLPHATVSIGYDKRYQRSALDALGRPPPPLNIQEGGNVMKSLPTVEQYFEGRTITVNQSESMVERIENAGFMQPPESRKWPGSKLQPFPIQSLESDFGASLPPAKPIATSLLAERQKFRCRYQGCDQMFSRRYTLQLHERTHLHAQDYYFWKRAPRIGQAPKANRINARGGGGKSPSMVPNGGSFNSKGRFRMSDKTGFGIQRGSDGGLRIDFSPNSKQRRK
eukprot:g9877.t1